ncbi:VWA domain-containing protein [Parvibaculum sp.]|uniref:VWA domain-containing protein n=1 Tax=Parvibaculum sp. TaxID=2024848 RepID=UPI001B0137F9|nr:VWA domain-containing protein [Parvibaculum sp.]MBO6635838.1 VWA domain-containing protein [Parvibaculum sp.]MBO6679326.1 VWA domain-containing protein [Parvibaculum sp.]MBO6686242.1 VWA domain-containing protein [Parvibaculum sp.]MBO6905883.1 VWA domain-containing protein [Parvibaculum sp.]
MSEVLGDFIRALRSADIRVSTSESIDAGNVVDLVGFDDRQTLKDALSQVLAKSDDEKQAFAETFDTYFSFEQFKERPAAANENDEDGDPGEQDGGDGEGGDPSQSGSASAPGGGGMGGEPSGEPSSSRGSDLAGLLERGDQAELQMALAEGARQAQLNRIRLFTQRGMFTRRIMENMGLDGLNEEIERREASGNARGAERLGQLREGLRSQVRDYVEKQLEIFTANSGRQLREEVLAQMRLSNVDRSDMKIMRELVRKMAKKLIALHSRRKKVTRRGMLDVRRTIRANIEYDGLLFHTIWKKTKVDRPKVMAVCDVSGSVAQVSRFLLMFLYSLQEVLPAVRSFAFSGHLGETTDLFKREKLEDALVEVLRDFGGGSTDYGQALMDLESLALDDIDHRTTILILGDARSNYGDPRGDILKKMHARARRVIWLNPEPRTMWNSGDSEMRRLAPYCDRALTCASLKDLERVVSDLLRSAV